VRELPGKRGRQAGVVRPVKIADGRCVAMLPITMVKNTPIDSIMPAFMKVARMPDATPRKRAGTELMMEEVLGEANSPIPMPIMKM